MTQKVIHQSSRKDIVVVHSTSNVSVHSDVAVNFRPARFAQEFEAMGYSVEVVAGSRAERLQAIRRVKRLVRKGASVKFLYSESNYTPTFINRHADKYQFSPLLDYGFFNWARRTGIPIGLYYRDALWMVPVSRGRVYRWLRRAAYVVDLHLLSALITQLFVPSLGFAKNLDVRTSKLPDQVTPLPPGAPSGDSLRVAQPRSADLRYLYAGSLNGHYDIAQLITAAQRAPSPINLHICTRERGWVLLSEGEKASLSSVATVTFPTHSEIPLAYASADIGLFITMPSEYMMHAVPVKVLEYFAYGLPVIATEGTRAAELVRESGAGWVCGSGVDDLVALFKTLQKSPSVVAKKRDLALAYARANTWRDRADQVVAVLTSDRGRTN